MTINGNQPLSASNLPIDSANQLPPPATNSVKTFSDEQLLLIFSQLKFEIPTDSYIIDTIQGLPDKKWKQLSKDQILHQALKALCLCSHPLTINEKEMSMSGDHAHVQALDASQNHLVWGLSEFKGLLMYDFSTKEKRTSTHHITIAVIWNL